MEYCLGKCKASLAADIMGASCAQQLAVYIRMGLAGPC